MRKWIAEHSKLDADGFRWRGHDVSRIEGFSDAVFAFALTLLVVALEVPKTYDQLMQSLLGFFAFGICFAILFQLWWSHYTFFRRYGLTDPFTITWNAVLLFLVLFFIYPLKFVFTAVLSGLFVVTHVLPDALEAHALQINHDAFAHANGSVLMSVYGAGYTAVSLVFALLYYHAGKLAKELELDPLEVHLTREEMQGQVVLASVGALSIVIANVIRNDYGPMLAGLSYLLLGPARAWHGARSSRTRPKRANAEPPHSDTAQELAP